MSALIYRLTPWFPRKLPTTKEEYEHMKAVLIKAYGVQDDPRVWATVAGHISSVPSFKIRVAWGSLANCGKRININELAQFFRQQAVTELQTKLEKAIKEFNEKEAQNVQNTTEVQSQENAVQEQAPCEGHQEGQEGSDVSGKDQELGVGDSATPEASQPTS